MCEDPCVYRADESASKLEHRKDGEFSKLRPCAYPKTLSHHSIYINGASVCKLTGQRFITQIYETFIN